MKEVFTRFCNGLTQVRAIPRVQAEMEVTHQPPGEPRSLLPRSCSSWSPKGGSARPTLSHVHFQIETLFKPKTHAQEPKHLGYILTCPSNLGTGLRAGVHTAAPPGRHEKFSEVLKRHGFRSEAQE